MNPIVMSTAIRCWKNAQLEDDLKSKESLLLEVRELAMVKHEIETRQKAILDHLEKENHEALP